MCCLALALGILNLACRAKVPDAWKELGLPDKGLKKVYDDTDDNGFYADYAGINAAILRKTVASALKVAGYSQACEAFNGAVVGYAKGEQRLAVKIDLLGDVIGLSVFNERGKERLIHGACFGKYKLGPGKRIK